MNQTVTTVLASILAGSAGGIAGGVATATIQRRGRKEGPVAQLVPLFGKGHYYTVAFSGGRIMWLDDLCYLSLLGSPVEVREFAGGYKFRFPDNVSAWLRVTPLAAPRQVGRLFEVRGIEAVRALRERCAVLEKNEEVEEVAVRMIGTTVNDYYEQQADALSGGRDARR